MVNGKIIKVKCPKCSEIFNYYDSSARPFCSERCKDIDLGLWLTENYKAPSKEGLSEEDIEEVMKSHEEDNFEEN
jgi:endogenous inhibitor of DNA gyrase (YacG/DUF329 family)